MARYQMTRTTIVLFLIVGTMGCSTRPSKSNLGVHSRTTAYSGPTPAFTPETTRKILSGDSDLSIPTTVPRLTGEMIRNVVTKKLGQVQFCYSNGLKNNQNLPEKVVLEWVVAPSGKVQRVDIVKSTIRNAIFETCLKENVIAWQFPSSNDDKYTSYTVRYPFLFIKQD